MSTPLHDEVKRLILDTVNITEFSAADIGDDDPLFGSGKLDLDSVDALEIAVELRRRYDVRLDDNNLAREILATPGTIATWLRSQGVGT